MNDQTIQIIEMFFNLVLVPVMIYGLKLAGDYLKTRANNEKLHTAIEMVEKAVESAVSETSQVFVDELKRQDAFNAEAAEQAAMMAFDKAKMILGGEAEVLLKHSMVDVNEFIMSKIEEVVRKNNTLEKLKEVAVSETHQS